MAALSDTTVLVTGATGQVGWGIAHAATEAGAHVVLPSRSATGADELAASFPEATVVHADVGTPDGAAAVVDAAVATGGLHHVVAPMGAWWQKGATLDQPPGELEDLLQTYVVAQLVLAQAALPHLRATGGSYTVVTGAAGEHLLDGAGLLVVAVNAQYSLVRVLAAELAGGPARWNEVRIAARVERRPRPGVIPSIEAGRIFVEVMTGDDRGRTIRWPDLP